jgi:chemotaxis signal transduction protein
MSDRVAELRHAFDHAFSQAPHERMVTKKYLVLGSTGATESRWAVSLDDITGVVPVRAIAPLPGAAHALLGIAGHRGVAFAVYDLSVLLGHAPTETVRWMVLCGPELGFGFSNVEGWVETERAEQALRVDGQPCIVIDVRAILEDLKKRMPAHPNGR